MRMINFAAVESKSRDHRSLESWHQEDSHNRNRPRQQYRRYQEQQQQPQQPQQQFRFNKVKHQRQGVHNGRRQRSEQKALYNEKSLLVSLN